MNVSIMRVLMITFLILFLFTPSLAEETCIASIDDKGVCIFPEDTREIDASIFEDSQVLKLCIPAFCTEVNYLNTEASRLNYVEVEEENKSFSTLNGMLYSKDWKIFLYCPRAINEEIIILPDSVEYIKDQAFEYVSNVKVVIIPSSVKEIGGFVFDNSSIETIILCGSQITLSVDTFNYCPSLRSIWIYRDSTPDELLREETDYIDLSGLIRYIDK